MVALAAELMPPIEIVPYDPEWPAKFAEIGGAIRDALAERALAIHHIGSTAVPGLAAKDVIDVQLTVADLDAPIREPLVARGYSVREDVASDHLPPGVSLPAEELAKRYFSRTSPRIHLHVRAAGRFNARYALLCRDYLRAHPLAAAAYAEIKLALAARFPEDQDSYYAVKDPVFDLLMVGAEAWALASGWRIPPSDA